MQKRRIYEGTYKEIEWRVLPSHRHLSWKTNRVGASGSNQVGSHQNEVVFAHVHLSPQPMMTNPGCPVETCPLEHLHALVLCKPPSGIKKSLRAFGYILGAVILSMMCVFRTISFFIGMWHFPKLVMRIVLNSLFCAFHYTKVKIHSFRKKKKSGVVFFFLLSCRGIY